MLYSKLSIFRQAVYITISFMDFFVICNVQLLLGLETKVIFSGHLRERNIIQTVQ